MCRHWLTSALVIVLILGVAMPPALAQGINVGGLSLSKELSIGGKGSEYVAGDYPGAVLMKVNLWGGAARSGMYYIPTKTDIVTLLSFAGGPLSDANLGDVYVKRTKGDKEEVIEVSINDLLKEKGKKSLVLEPNDIVVIPQSKPFWSQNTVTTVGIISGVMAIVLTGFLLDTTLRNRKR